MPHGAADEKTLVLPPTPVLKRPPLTPVVRAQTRNVNTSVSVLMKPAFGLK